MKKRILSLLLALVMLFGLLPVTARAGELDNGLLYEVYEDHVEITGYTGEIAEVMIPAEIEGLPVTSIGYDAFSSCSSLTSIVIPDSVTSIYEDAFHDCSNLTSIDLPNSITYIDDGTFSGCSSLTSITIPDSVTRICSFAFYGCSSLTRIVIPDNVTYIGEYAFSWCSSLNSIVIPSSVTSIYEYAFNGCSCLNSIRFVGNAPWIGESGFGNVSATAYFPIENPTWTADVMLNYGGDITWVAYGSTTPVNPFTDVRSSDYYYDPVLWALENSITSGTAPNEFSPYDSCLRSQVVTFLWRAAGEPQAESAVNPFVDVKPSDYYYDAVLWAVEKGITTGADTTHFEPNGVCNRAQVVTFLYRAFDKPSVEGAANPFTDVSAGAWYAAPVLWAVKEGITNGLSATEFGPNEVCNRSQVVTFLYRAYN